MPANSSFRVSQFAPYSMWNNQLTLGGAPPWPPTELTPWYLDEQNFRINYDPSYPGLGGINSGYPATTAAGGNMFANIVDLGQSGWINTIGQPNPTTVVAGNQSAQNITPGVQFTCVAGGFTVVFNCNFNLTMNFQRKRHLLWGAIPFGDPENRPNNIMQLLNLVGSNPEQCMIVSPSTNATFVNAVTAVTTGVTTVNATYELAYIDLLPDGVQLPEPNVGFGLQLVPSTVLGVGAGSYTTVTHRTAMAYTAIHHLLFNTNATLGSTYQPVQSSYFGLWDDQDPQSARWQFDVNTNTFQQYFTNYHRIQRQYPTIGQYTADFENGVFPEVPSVTPYDAIMSPDATYAQAFGVPVTPAMTTAVRLPTGTTTTGSYVRVYAFGLVKVPY